MNKFVEAMLIENNYKLTENGALALRSTMSDLVDAFGVIGAIRDRPQAEVERIFSKAFNTDKLLAWKMAFHARNIRGGLGERHTFRVILHWMAMQYPETVEKNLGNVAQFGRWDDLYTLVGTPVEEAAFAFMLKQVKADGNAMKAGEPISLLGKWLKSINTSSEASRKLGKLTAKHFGLTHSTYRKMLSSLRAYLKVVEVYMSKGEWTGIDYSAVPSKAMMNYRKAFARHDETGFSAFMDNVEKGEVEIKASTLYPYDIVQKILNRSEVSRVLEAQWKALPNYVEGEAPILIMADTSDSMTWHNNKRALATSVGLAIYFAERNTGPFADCFVTFSSRPDFVQLKGETLGQKVGNVPCIAQSTDIWAAMRLILKAGLKHGLAQADMPSALIIISDMEFDNGTRGHGTFHKEVKAEFNAAGYELPRIVYWNVEARQNTFHAQANEQGVQFASGHSPSVFKSILENVEVTAFELMVNTLNDPMYDGVIL
jgi:hypothetical protein